MKEFYEKTNVLTQRQRTFAFDLMTDYSTKLQQLPTELKMKIIEKRQQLAQIKEKAK
jgi:hypothetical protein